MLKTVHQSLKALLPARLRAPHPVLRPNSGWSENDDSFWIRVNRICDEHLGIPPSPHPSAWAAAVICCDELLQQGQ
jgi:hypothetical protein